MSSQFATKIAEQLAATMGILQIYIGDKLNLFQHLKDCGKCTSEKLAEKSQLQERYVREWLHACATNGYVTYDPSSREFELPEEHAVVLLNKLHLDYMAPFVHWVPLFGKVLPQILTCFKNGGGVPFEDYGPECVDLIAQGNRPMFENETLSWIETMPDVKKTLETGGKILDVGCGCAYSTVALAKAFPKTELYAIDIDATSIEKAKVNIANAGLNNRIQAFCCPAHLAPIEKHSCDLVTIFECLHDISNPVEVLSQIREMLKPGTGVLLIAEEKIENRLEDMCPKPNMNEKEFERNILGKLNYGFSVLHCLPQSLHSPGSAGIGTLLTPVLLEKFAIEAGFKKVTSIHENSFWRFYRLQH